MNKYYLFPENCYQNLKHSENIFDRMAAALVILRLNDTGEHVPQEEIEFAYAVMREYHIETIKKEQSL